MSDWISVKDKLPEPYELVLVCGTVCDGGKKKVVIDVDFQTDDLRFYRCGGIAFDVTHWQYLPELPKEVDAE